MWESVECELHTLLGILPFLEASLSLKWGDVAYEVAAGPERTAVLTTPADHTSLRLLAQLAERGGWLLNDVPEAETLLASATEDRLGSASGASAPFARSFLPRDARAAKDAFAKSLAPRVAHKPREADSSWFPASRWTTVFVHKLRFREHNTISEVRCATQAVRHFSSSPRNWHRRLVVISDAGAAIGCLSKGRSGSRLANILCRQAAAAVCIADLRVYYRWVSSANNQADGPSRGSRFAGVAAETVAKARQAWNAFARATAASG